MFFLKKYKKTRVFPKTLNSVSLRNSRSRKKSLYKKTLTMFFIGLGFFTLSILTYKFQNLIPRIPSDANKLVRPDTNIQGISIFKKELIRYAVQFESITYATQSSTLIVKLPKDVYAYLNTSLDPSSQARLLSNILFRIAIENKGKTLKYVDLTHKKAIVKFW